MGLIITPRQKINEYFESQAVSQSRLKTLVNGLESFLRDQDKSERDLYYSEKTHLVKGSAVDTKLTGEEDDFGAEFYISRLDSKPTDTEMSIIHRTFDSLVAEGKKPHELQGLVNYHSTLIEAIEAEKWYKGNPGEKRIGTLVDNTNLYFMELAKSHGRQIISLEEIDVIDRIVDSLKTHPRTKDYFDRASFFQNTSADVYYQFPIYFEYQGKECKALLDILIVYKDESNNIVSVQPIDIKTMTGPTLRFPSSFKSFRYDIQAAWYTLALESWLETQNTVMYPVIMNFKFIVESTTKPGSPVVFTMDESLLHIGRYGRPELLVNAHSTDDFDIAHLDEIRYKEVKGYESLFDDYMFYQENGTEEERLVVENDGVFKLDWNGIM